MTGAFPLELPGAAAWTILALWGFVCVWLTIARAFTGLIACMLAAGVAQGVLLVTTGNLAFQLVDDIPAALLVIVGVARSLRDVTPDVALARRLLLATTALVVVAAVRSPDLAAAAAQARQILLPAGLMLSGYLLRDRINWMRALQVTVAIGAGVVVWMLIEAGQQWPLMHPTAAARILDTHPGFELRNGLPSAYYADGITETPWFRPGGPFFNPPTAGFFLGLVTFAWVQLKSRALTGLGLALTALCLGLSIARAGILIAICVTGVYWCWRHVSRFTTVVGVLMGAYVVFGLYAQQGNTASHSKGMIDGLVHATATGIGSGFGTFGYLSSNRTDGVAESLLGLYFGWMGLPMVLIVGLVACRLAQNLRAETESSRLRVLWLAVGVLAASALSETASALSATGLTWMLFGMALAGGRDLMSSADDATSQPRFPQLAKDYADLPPATGSTTAGKWPPGPRSVLRPNWSPQPPLAPARTYPDVVTRLTV